MRKIGLILRIVPVVVLVMVGLASCEKTIDVEPPAERELVLNAVPAAGRQAFVYFGYTRFFLDTDNDQPVGDAEMTFRVNGVARNLDSVRRSKYFFDHVLQEDDTLSVDVRVGEKRVHAETYVPKYPAVSNVSNIYMASSTFNFVVSSFDLSDHAGRSEYYNVTVTERDSGARFNEWTGKIDTVDTVHSAMFLVPLSEEITSSEVASYSPMGGRLMFLDRNIEGQTYKVPLWIMYLKDTTEVEPFKHEFKVEIESVTPARFRYILSASSQGGLTSFFAEQGRVYSNVEGALGVFAGSAKREYSFSLDTILPTPMPSTLPAEVEMMKRGSEGGVRGE